MRHAYLNDTLELLQDRIRYDFLDLVYYIPPFYSKGDYNLLFRPPIRHHSEMQRGLQGLSGRTKAVCRLPEK